jgi:aspartate carbamoyltransferase catalytic subunit
MKVDMVVMRHPAPGAHMYLSQRIDANIINAGDGTHEHPTQALLDAYSIRERLGSVSGKKIVIVGDIKHSRVALSNIYCLNKLGAEVKLCGPLRSCQNTLKASASRWNMISKGPRVVRCS